MQGIIIINKPQGYTSQDAVSKVKKILNLKKAGHTGTLDPMATGVLPILIGEYTKLSKYLIEHDKTYKAKIKLGEKTETGDSEGNVLEKAEVKFECLDEQNVKKILNTFLGKQKQLPPMYSAIKVDGKKLYEYAREGKKVDVNPRDIEIYNIKLIHIDKEKIEIEFEVSCSKGTYIRVLCEDIAQKLGTLGYMSSLQRTCVNKFLIEDSIDFETLEQNKNNIDFIESKLVKMETIFRDLPKMNLNERKKELFLNGVMLTYELKDGLYNIYDIQDNYIGTGIVKNKLLKRDIII